MKSSRSSRLLVLGFAVFVIGAGLVFVATRGGGEAASPRARTAPPAAKQAQPKVRVAGGAAGKLVQVALPKGMEGVTVTLRGAPGLAGYAKAGDHVNIYATIKSAPKSENPPLAKLIAPELEVLQVTALSPGATGEATYLLAVPAGDARKLIFFARFESLWFTLAHPDQAGLPARAAHYENSL